MLKFSTCGRFLASGGSDANIFIWDISTSVIIAQFSSHKDPVYTLDFSRDNAVLASGNLYLVLLFYVHLLIHLYIQLIIRKLR